MQKLCKKITFLGFLSFFGTSLIFGQTTLYLDNFTGEDDKGTIGLTTDVAGVDWSINTSAGTFSDNSDYFAVQSGVFETQDVDGVVIFTSETFSINGYVNLQLSLDAGANGDFEASGDIYEIRAYIDGSPQLLFEGVVDDAAPGDPMFFGSTQLSSTLQSFSANITGTGTNAYVEISVNNNADSEQYFFDNLEVTGILATDTIVQFDASSITVNEGDGTADISLTILNQDATNATNVQVALNSGDAGDINNYTTQSVTFPAGSSLNQTVTITITDDVISEVVETLTFALQNVSGGNNAQIGVQDSFDLIIEDNELPILIINEIFADPANDLSGDSNGDGTRDSADDEFIELYNTSGITLDISNYILKEGSTNKHVFPAGTIIPPNGSIVVFGGGNTSGFTNVGGIVQVASGGNLSLNNSGDTVSITDESNNTIDSYTYGSEADNDQSIARSPDFTGAFVQHTSIGSNSINFSPGKDNTDNAPFVKTWIGATDNSWTTSTNWLDGDVPGTTDNVIIPNRTSIANFPIDSGTIQLNDLIIESNASLQLTPTSNTNTAVLNLTGNLFNNGNLTFSSNEFGTAQFDEFSGTLSGSGNVTVERYMSANRAFRLVSSPVTTTNFISNNWQQNTHITGADGATNGFDATATNNPSMFTFDNSNTNGGTQDDDYTSIANTDATNLVVGTPYVLLVRGDRTIDHSASPAPAANETTLSATGSLHVGEYPGSNASVPLSDVADFWSLVANPYQANVDFDNLTRAGDLKADISVYDPANKGYVALSSNKIIKPGQSFWVQNESTINTNPSLYFEETDKAVGSSNATVVFSTDQTLAANLELYRQGENTRKDVLQFKLNSNFDSNLDDKDFGKLFNQDENLATSFSMLLSIDRRAIPQDNDIIPLFTNQYRDTNYEFRINLDNWDPNIEVFVQDNYLNTTTQITPNQAYTFSVDTNIPQSTAEDRFSLVFDNTTLSVENSSFGSDFSLYPNPTRDGNFSITTPSLSGEVEVSVTDMLGKTVVTRTYHVVGHTINVDASKLNAGIYAINLTQGNKTYTTKVMIE